MCDSTDLIAVYVFGVSAESDHCFSFFGVSRVDLRAEYFVVCFLSYCVCAAQVLPISSVTGSNRCQVRTQARSIMCSVVGFVYHKHCDIELGKRFRRRFWVLSVKILPLKKRGYQKKKFPPLYTALKAHFFTAQSSPVRVETSCSCNRHRYTRPRAPAIITGTYRYRGLVLP